MTQQENSYRGQFINAEQVPPNQSHVGRLGSGMSEEALDKLLQKVSSGGYADYVRTGREDGSQIGARL